MCESWLWQPPRISSQIFYSLGVGVGSQLLLCSYNSFTTNCHRQNQSPKEELPLPPPTYIWLIRRNNLWLLCQIFLLKNNLQGCLVDFFGQFSHFRLCRLCGFRDSWHACPQQRGGCGGGDHCRGRSHFPGTSEFQDPPNLHPTMWAGESMCSGVPWGDHPDASCAALQLSLLCHALPSCHVLHSWQVLLMPCWPYCIINLILYFAGKLLLT